MTPRRCLLPLSVVLLVLSFAATAVADQPVPLEAGPTNQEAAPVSVTKNLKPVPSAEAFGVLGKKVAGADGEDMGPVVDVLVGEDGAPRAAVIDFGGFLGVGSRKIAVDWHLLQFLPAEHDPKIVLRLDRADVQAAPEYKPPDQPAQVVEPPPSEPAGQHPDAQAPDNAGR